MRNGKDEIIENGMERLLEDSVIYALNIHDNKHRNHLELGDNYGWMIVHNGVIEKIVVKAGSGGGNATARSQLKEIASKLPKKNWVGVVMAGMNPSSFYAVNYEKGILQGAVDNLEMWFSQYFHEI